MRPAPRAVGSSPRPITQQATPPFQDLAVVAAAVARDRKALKHAGKNATFLKEVASPDRADRGTLARTEPWSRVDPRVVGCSNTVNANDSTIAASNRRSFIEGSWW